MSDPPRGNSLPPTNDDFHSLINPAYSGSLTDNSNVRYSSSSQEMVDIEIDSSRKQPETAAMKKIKFAVIILFILIGILIVFNCIHFAFSLYDRSSLIQQEKDRISDWESIVDIAVLSAPVNSTDDDENIEISTTIETIESSETPITSESSEFEPSSTTTSTIEEKKDEYRNYTERFNRTYSEKGYENYLKNMKFWMENGSFTFGETQFADMTLKELRELVSKNRRTTYVRAKRCDIHKYINSDRSESNIMGSALYGIHDRVPVRVDLRKRGILATPRNQGTSCDGGYAFSVASLLESMVDTNGTRLSVQMLLADEFNHHCEGGDPFRAMESVQNDGLVTDDILPFDASRDGHDLDFNTTQRYSNGEACMIVATRRSTYQRRYYEDADETSVSISTYIEHFLGKIGPVLVELPVNQQFFFYKGGIYLPPCGSYVPIGYQPMLIVGYGMKDGTNVWILRNSFGTEWGMNGDLLISRDAACSSFNLAYSFYKTVGEE